MDEQEIEQTIRTAMQEIADLGTVSKDTADKLDDIPVQLKRAMQDVSRSLGGLGNEIARGEAGFKTMDFAIDAVTGSLGGLASMIPVVGKGLQKIAETAGTGFKLLNERLMTSVTTFQQVAKTGAIGSGGLEQFTKAAIGSNLSLSQFQKVVTDNSNTLANFRGLTSTGANAFSEIIGELTQGGTGRDLRALGFSAEDLGEAAGSLLTLATRTGMSQRMSNTQLAQASADYAKELDALAKLSGEEVDTIAARNNAMLNETRFRARLEQLGPETSRSIQNFTNQLSRFEGGEVIGRAVRDLFATGGVPISDESRALVQATGGGVTRIIQGLESGALTVGQANAQLQDQIQQSLPFIQSQARFLGDSNFLTQQTVGLSEIANANLGRNGELLAEANRQQELQLSGADKLTTSAVESQRAFEALNREIDMVTINFLPAFAGILETSAKGILKAVRAATGALGIDEADIFTTMDTTEPMSAVEQDRVEKQKQNLSSFLERKGIEATPENIKILKMFGAYQGSQMIQDPGRELGGTNILGFGPDAGLRRIVERQTGTELPADATVQDALNTVSKAQIPGFQAGGVVAGPKTGYTTMLHGTEAVIPMDTGQTSIPVELKGMNNSMSQQMGIMKQQLDRLDSMVQMLGRSNRAQQDMLQSSYS
tara:strand:+ start:8058 stop:10025 length:1968 start_codon:yes stop_codon:yes gene_type:complete